MNMKKFILAASVVLYGMSANILSAQQPEYKEFTKEDKRFNDWSLSLFGGLNALQNTDLVSWGRDEGKSWFTPGYDFAFSVNRQLTHAFGISLQYQMGKTRQQAWIMDDNSKISAIAHGKTSYQSITFLGDVNFSNLLRRVENQSELKLAFHGYAGVGVLGYKAKRDYYGKNRQEMVTVNHIKMGDKSIYAQVGAGLRYKLNENFDTELRGMYFLSGDEQFDASGMPNPRLGYTPADMNPGREDNMILLTLGLHYKIGKHKEALQWAPYSMPVPVMSATETPFECVDEDNDGVCDQWDRCPGTPEGYTVDGSGCPLDTDGDGVVDTIDECPTIPGPPTNLGCPEVETVVSADQIAGLLTETIQGIEFDYDSDKIRQVSYSKLDNAAEVIMKHPNYNFWVEGHTDAAGPDAYNQNLSERRAASVVRYLVNKGVNSAQLFPIGKGESELKHPECNPTTNCPAWKNLENRRVVFKEKK
ncbi:Outer membrane porin F precursor [Weeksella virosa]|uniref:OmpA/MotB domain protein n=2 Tax=Weeksella virosa TaxID=1014 RepID=F0NYN6_WEEVC|nr:OmpA/MotB domain protein [Weeksella virosa DSM 16922]SUP54478.1 Outer membrane porin F precursor [Weeksella virosa]VEH64198.1 Outer membrane porin F precursor [Weeksella virosa]